MIRVAYHGFIDATVGVVTGQAHGRGPAEVLA